jgi:hypothetical protein
MGQYLPVIALALSAAGTGAGMAAASKARSDVNKQIRNQINTQKDFQKRATPVVQESIEQSGADVAGQQFLAGKQNADVLYEQLSTLPQSASFNPIQLSGADRQRVVSTLKQQRGVQSSVMGLKDFALQQWLKNMDVGRKLGVINNLSAASSAQAPFLANLAAQNSANMAGIGSLLSTAGGLAGMYAAVNSPQLGVQPIGTGPSSYNQAVGLGR